MASLTLSKAAGPKRLVVLALSLFLLLLVPKDGSGQMALVLGSDTVIVKSTQRAFIPDGGYFVVQNGQRWLAGPEVKNIKGQVVFTMLVSGEEFRAVCVSEAFKNIQVSGSSYTVVRCSNGEYVYFAPGDMLHPAFEVSSKGDAIKVDPWSALRMLRQPSDETSKEKALWRLVQSVHLFSLRDAGQKPFVFTAFE